VNLSLLPCSFAPLLTGGSLPSAVGGRKDYIWALKGVSFEVKRGEVVGIIGRNGAGCGWR
jgi:lipopolysaccharide transport system ATP-binding protein